MEAEYTSDSPDSFTPFNVPGNAERFKEVARKELGETEDLKETCLKQLRKLIEGNNVACITEDDFLLRFLRIKKFDVQKSFQIVQNYAKQRAYLHSRFLKLEREKLETILRHNMIGFLPYRDADDRLIFFGVVRSWNPGICSPEEMMKVVLLISYYAAEKQSSQTTGLTFIVDIMNTPWSYIPYALMWVRTITSVAFNGLPVRYKEFYCINATPVLRFFLRLINPLLPKKIKKRFHIQGESGEILATHFAPTILPDDFGGSLGPLNSDHLLEELQDYLEKFKEEQKYFLVNSG